LRKSPYQVQESRLRRKYKKQGPPDWQRKLVVFVFGLFGATILMLAAWAVILFTGPGQ
jgi:hypothetical protein